MKTPVSVLARGDLKLILRDSTLVLMLFAPLAITGLLFFMPTLEQLIQVKFGFDLSPYHLFAIGFLNLVPGMIIAMIYGFIILDERDEAVIDFISITPLRKQGYLRYKLVMPMLLSGGFFLVLILASLPIPLNPVYGLVLAVMVAIEAAIGTLFLVVFSENKVEGLAFSKLLGLMYMAFPLVFFWDSNWHWLTAFLPPFWIAKSLQHIQLGSPWIWGDLLGGLIVHAGVLAIFLRLFLRRSN